MERTEIIKALECCTRGRKGDDIPCPECPYNVGEYGNIFELEKVFESGFVPRHRKKKYESEVGE
jgi:hypothetical protein